MLIRRNTLKVAAFLVLVFCVVVSTGINARSRDKVETISASAVGTGTQAGGLSRITLVVYEFSTEADREILIKAFEKSGTEGLSNALHKMNAVGRLELTKSISYDVSFIRSVDTPKGRVVRFITNRKIAFGELYTDAVVFDYKLTAGEFQMNDSDMKQSAGVLYPAAKLTLNKQGDVTFELNQNPWKLTAITDWREKSDK